jgi:glycosyltransferase involved in cell wall biosynthesis
VDRKGEELNYFPFKVFENVSLSVIVPVYNEGSKFKENLKLLLDEIQQYFLEFEILVINDGSSDGDHISDIKSLHGSVQLISLNKNQGKGAAVRRGFSEASGDFILFIDGGMEIHPEEIKIFVGLMHLYQADVVIGSKRHPQSQVKYPIYRRILSIIFQLLVKRLFHINVTDTQVGIKMFRKEVIKEILPHLKTDSYGFDIEILGLCSHFGHRKILEAPVRLDYFLKSKRPVLYDLFHTLRVGTALLKDTFNLWKRLKIISISEKK